MIDIILQWAPVLLSGLLVTLKIGVLAFILGILLGCILAAAKLGGSKLLRWVATCYTTFFRSVPEILLIIILFYSGTDLVNLLYGHFKPGASVDLDGFSVAVGVLALVVGAYSSEVIRGAVEAVPTGQIEAANAFNLGFYHRARHVVLPAMTPFLISGLSNLWIIVLKDTALVSLVGYSELVYSAKQIAGVTKQYFLFYAVVGLIFYAILSVSNVLVRFAERRMLRWNPRSE